jgi:gamma-glutamyltranspeptidase/glutathione hydrolase
VACPDRLATEAGLSALAEGGSAADAAIATSAALAVTFQHACGIGGDLFCCVRALDAAGRPKVEALDSAGIAGSGADPARLRAAGARTIPPHGDIAAVPVPGCVDGWLALHARYGRLPLATVLAPAIELASLGFAMSPGLVAGLHAQVASSPVARDYFAAGPPRPGQVVTRPGVARLLRAIVDGGRAACYEGELGAELLALGAGEYEPSDLAVPLARWVAPLSVPAFGAQLFTAPPTSQGYLTLAASAIASELELPADPDDPRFAHLLVEAVRAASFDRLDVLYDGADGAALIAPERLAARRGWIDDDKAMALGVPSAPGGTVAVVAVDRDGGAVSMLQSNASGFGSGLGLEGLGIFLQNRGTGFCLEAGHPAEYGPRRRPPHTLSPLIVTTADGELLATMATMGGDTQPQILLQLLARLLVAHERPDVAVNAGRFALGAGAPSTRPAGPPGFDTWSALGRVTVGLEDGVPTSWAEGLLSRGHDVRPGARPAGHAQVIVSSESGLLAASDPRSAPGAAGMLA